MGEAKSPQQAIPRRAFQPEELPPHSPVCTYRMAQKLDTEPLAAKFRGHPEQGNPPGAFFWLPRLVHLQNPRRVISQ